MKGLALIEKWIGDLLTSIMYCIGQPMATPACRPHWTIVMYTSFAIGALIAYKLARIAWRDYKRHKEVIARELAEMTIASPDVMREHQWKGNDAFAGEDPQVDVNEIKRALLAKRQEPAKPSAAMSGRDIPPA